MLYSLFWTLLTLSIDMCQSIKIINFGKHKGKPISWLFKYKTDYCNWILEQEQGSEKLKEVQKEIKCLQQKRSVNVSNVFDQYKFVPVEDDNPSISQSQVQSLESYTFAKDSENKIDEIIESKNYTTANTTTTTTPPPPTTTNTTTTTTTTNYEKRSNEIHLFENDLKGKKRKEQKNFDSNTCLLLDIETTICKDKHLLEIGFLKFKKNSYEIIEMYESLVKFENNKPFKKYYKNNITKSMCNNYGKELSTVLDELREHLIDVDEIYAYNVMFDINKILQLSVIHDRTDLLSLLKSKNFYDIMDFGKSYQRQKHNSKKYSAEIVYNNLFGTNITEDHRSLSDCKIELQILENIPLEYKQKARNFTVEMVDTNDGGHSFKLKRAKS